MKAGRTFVTACALAAGLAVPFFVAAQLSGRGLDAEAQERLERGIEQLDSDSQVLRELGLNALTREGEAALPTLRERADSARRAGNLDLEMRIRDAIAKIETDAGMRDQPEPPRQSGSQGRVVIQPGSGAVKSTVFVENGRITSIEQDAGGKITLKVTENGTETVSTFDNEQAFKDAHPELAQKFAGAGGAFTFRVPAGPFGRGGANEPDEEVELPDLFRGFGFEGQRPAGRSPAEELSALKERLAELRGMTEGLGEQGDALRRKMGEVDEAVKRLEESMQPRRVVLPAPRDPFEEMNRMMEDMRKRQEEAMRRFREGNADPFERFRRPQPEPAPAPRGGQQPAPETPDPAPDKPLPERKSGASADF